MDVDRAEVRKSLYDEDGYRQEHDDQGQDGENLK